MSDKGTVFTVKYACDNCGKEWSDEYHEKIKVWRTQEIPGGMGMTRYMPPVPSRLYASDSRKKPMVETLIKCPNCKTHQDVKIVQRIPIEERSTID